MHAVRIRTNVVLDGLRVGRTRIVHVVDSLPEPVAGDRELLTKGEAKALVELGYAEPVSPEFEQLTNDTLRHLPAA